MDSSFGTLEFNPGPVNPSVLWDQKNHISEIIWAGKERKSSLRSIQGGSTKLYQDWVLNNRQRKILEGVGFGFFAHRLELRHDDQLINALVERWRSETNTFHFSQVGEMTITLEDVGFILGLPVMGKPLTLGKQEEMRFIAKNRLGIEIPYNAYDGGGVKLTWIRETFGQLPEDYTDDHVWYYTKAYIWCVIGSVLFPTSCKNTVHPKYLLFLDDINQVHTYAWGAAVLAYLYRALHKATRIDATSICACITLLQIWSYERIPFGRPEKIKDFSRVLPRGLAWAGSSKRKDAHHNLRSYRAELDGQAPEQACWDPYKRWKAKYWEGEEIIPFDWVVAGLVRTPLIHFDIVEYQMPERVMRQFGCFQDIPRPALEMETLVALRVAGPLEKHFKPQNAASLREKEINEWNMWQENLEPLVQRDDSALSIQFYNEWYQSITRMRLNPVRMSGGWRYQPRGDIDRSALNLELQAEEDRIRNEIADVLQKIDSVKEGKKQLEQTYLEKEREYKEAHEALGSKEGEEQQLTRKWIELVKERRKLRTKNMEELHKEANALLTD